MNSFYGVMLIFGLALAIDIPEMTEKFLDPYLESVFKHLTRLAEKI